MIMGYDSLITPYLPGCTNNAILALISSSTIMHLIKILTACSFIGEVNDVPIFEEA